MIKYFCKISVLSILILGGITKPASAQYYFQSLILEYLDAIESGDEDQISDIRQKLYEDESAINYLKRHYPNVYRTILRDIELQEELFVDQTSESFDIADQVDEFPNKGRISNKDIVESEANQNKWNNTDVARRFPIQNRPSNQDLIAQRLSQDRQSGIHDEYDSRIKAGGIVISISGVDESERESVLQILKDEFKTIQTIEEIEYDNGVIYLGVTIDMPADQFSERLDARNFPSFSLELIRFRPDKIDYVIKSL